MSCQSEDSFWIKPVIFRLEYDDKVKDRISVRVPSFRDDQINHLRWRKLVYNDQSYDGANFVRGTAGHARHAAPYVIVCSSSMFLLPLMLGHLRGRVGEAFHLQIRYAWHMYARESASRRSGRETRNRHTSLTKRGQPPQGDRS